MRYIKELDQLIDYIQGLYKSLPPLPKGLIEFIVAITPWIALIFGVLGVLASLAAVGLTTFLSPLMILGGGVSAAAGLTISAILALVTSAIMVIAVPSLFGRKMMGWRLLFISELLGIVSAVVTISIVGVIFPLIWIYVLFQMKPYYK